jgi:DNA uptake protein ComE-like DNA-binding protein
MKAFLAGLGVGAVIGLLLAPQKGSKTWADIGEYGGKLFNRTGGRERSAYAEGISESETIAEVLNTASKHDLMSVDGIGNGTAKKIISNRPYETVEEVVQEGVLPEEIVDRIKEQLVDKTAV